MSQSKLGAIISSILLKDAMCKKYTGGKQRIETIILYTIVAIVIIRFKDKQKSKTFLADIRPRHGAEHNVRRLMYTITFTNIFVTFSMVSFLT